MTMTKEDIIVLPNPHLRQKSAPVKSINQEVKQLALDMEAAVRDWDASRTHEVTVALAAVQVNKLHRVIIVRDDFDREDPATYTALINPQITKYEGAIKQDYEGCLSIRSVYGMVPRYERIRVKGLDINGKEVKIKAEGFLARVLQHEIDHLNGKVFIDCIKNKRDAFYKLTDKGKLEPLDYEKDVRNNSILW